MVGVAKGEERRAGHETLCYRAGANCGRARSRPVCS
jgi:hypothetical protein